MADFSPYCRNCSLRDQANRPVENNALQNQNLGANQQQCPSNNLQGIILVPDNLNLGNSCSSSSSTNVAAVQTGSIICFSSNDLVSLSSLNTEHVLQSALLSQQNFLSVSHRYDRPINIQNIQANAQHFVFTFPRNGILNSITSYFTTSKQASFSSNAFVQITFYKGCMGNPTFFPMDVAVKLKPNLTQTLPAGYTIYNITENMNLHFKAGEMVFIMFQLLSSNLTTPATVSGYATATINVI